MNKKIIPAEASFFVPVEKVLFDHSKMRRSLETAAAENYPALTEDIMWDYTLFTFEKKKWALISITDRSTYGEECIRHSSRPNNEYVLYSYGEPVAMSADGNASYFGTDILGSVRNVTDKYGAVQSSYDYDAFGSPYLGNLDNDMSFGYTGKAYDAGTGLYDYGFRDYSPNSARFTTVDPIRDGSNWFSYVVNDPVNYVDPLGLETAISKDIKETLSDFKSAIANLLFPGEITNETTYELFPRAESNKITADLLRKNFIIPQNKTLSEALANTPNVSYKHIALDGLVLPDGSIYKGWAGSKITVTEKNGKFEVKESLLTQIVHKVVNTGRKFLNNFRDESEKKDLYRHYTADEVKDLEKKPSDNISKWEKDVPENYRDQMEADKEQTVNTNKGCTK